MLSCFFYYYFFQIQEADQSKLDELAQNEELIQIIEDVGEVCRLSVSTIDKI